jgi:hypothetical protein
LLNFETGSKSVPKDVETAKSLGWILDKNCSKEGFYNGYRYKADGDPLMIIFDANGLVAGKIQEIKTNLNHKISIFNIKLFLLPSKRRVSFHPKRHELSIRCD